MMQKKWTDSLRDVLLKKAVQSRRPLSCTFELTYRCNFYCKMCYVHMTDQQAEPFGRMRSVEEWLDMASQLRDAGVLYLNLTGGECTRYPGFAELYEKLYAMGFRITIMSNAGAYSDAIRALFRRYPPYGAAVSLYGGSDETYAAVTGDPRGLTKTVENIRFFQELNVPLSLNFTMIRTNVLDYPKVAELAQSLSLPYNIALDITPHQYDAGFSEALDCRLSPAELVCVNCHPPEEVEIALENAKELEKELEHFSLPEAAEETQELNECIGSKSSCSIFWNGDMSTCISMKGSRMVHPFETGFEAAWKQLQEQHAEMFRMASACRNCGLRSECHHNCPARNFEGTKNPMTPDPHVCRYTYLMTRYKETHNRLQELPEASCADK